MRCGCGYCADLGDTPLFAKLPACIESIIAAKLNGMKVLADIFPDGAIMRLMLLYSTSTSTSTVTEPVGRVDYVAANEYLYAVE